MCQQEYDLNGVGVFSKLTLLNIASTLPTLFADLSMPLFKNEGERPKKSRVISNETKVATVNWFDFK